MRNIDPCFINHDRVAYYRRLELHKSELYDSANKPILRGIQEKFGQNVIVSQSIYMNDFHFSVQTDYMHACLTRTYASGRVIIGLQTDTTFKFFKSGYLLSTVAYNQDLCRWMPVLYTYMEKMTKEHHLGHFRVLFGAINSIEGITADEINDLVAHTVDYSAAQKAAFIEAYVNIFESRFQHQKEAEDMAHRLIKGCKEHFRASCVRLIHQLHCWEKRLFKMEKKTRHPKHPKIQLPELKRQGGLQAE